MDRDEMVRHLWQISNQYWDPAEPIAAIMSTFDILTDRLARAEAVVEAARKWKEANNVIDRYVDARELVEDDDPEYVALIAIELRQERVLTRALASYDATSAGGEGGEGGGWYEGG